jgi:hypothetical protein
VRIVYNHLSIYGARVKVASFGGVCTHPAYRNRGIATKLLEACIKETTEANAAFVIISGMRGLYRRVGSVLAGPVWHVRLERRELRSARTTVSVRQIGDDDWKPLARLHQQEPVRFLRTGTMYSHVGSHWHHRGLWLVEHEGRAVAYVCLSRLWGLPREAPVRALSEYAGSRAALVDALPALCRESGLSKIEMAFPQFDQELAYLLTARGLELTPDTIPSHSFRLLNLPGLMRALRPYLLARLTGPEARELRFEQRGDACRFGYGAETKETDLSQAAAIVLGGHRAPRLTGDLGRVLGRLLPVPMPLPGLNYV